MKKLGFAWLLVLVAVPVMAWTSGEVPYAGSTFGNVWETVASDPYAELPHVKVTLRSFFHYLHSRLRDSARRTLSDRNDLLPRFDKLVHPNGICFAGTWNITEENPYSGYFAKGSQALIVARASAALSGTAQGEYRAFGFAGKLFPTTDSRHSDLLPTANFFLVDDLGGTLARHYTDVQLTNHPTSSARFSVIGVGAAAFEAFRLEDRNPMVRQLYEVSELGLADKSQAHTPGWMMIQASSGQTVEQADFRDELRLKEHGGNLRFDIFVAPRSRGPATRIGFIELNEDAVSDSCDHRLHFHHPRWR